MWWRRRSDPTFGSVQGFRQADDARPADYAGSRFADVREAVFRNPYQDVWGDPHQRALPQYDVSLCSVLRPQFRKAAARTVDSVADLRWGKNGKGFRRLVHPNGVCLTGVWEITEPNPFSGYFQCGKKGLVIARISAGGPDAVEERFKSFSIVGKIYPTLDKDHPQPLRPANFFVQDNLGGTAARRITDVEMKNAPDINALNRGFGITVLVIEDKVFRRADRVSEVRQVYPIAELGQPADAPVEAPEFMRLKASPGHLVVDAETLRDEVMAHIFDPGNPVPQRTLSFEISVANDGRRTGHPLLPSGQRHEIGAWQRIGTLTFDDAVVSYNGDFVLHFNHPPWRLDRNNPDTAVRQGGARVRT